MTNSLPTPRLPSPFSSFVRRYARIRIAVDRGGRARLTARPRPLGYVFRVAIRQRANERLVREPKRLAAEQAAQYASDNAIGCIDAAIRFGSTLDSVDAAWRRLFPGVPCPHRTKSKIERAVDFVVARDCTVRRAADVYGVSPEGLLAAYNKATGQRRQFVGEAAARLSLTQLGAAGNREAHYLEKGGVE